MDKICRITLAILAIAYLCDAYPISSRQFLPHRPGYVPVYIRNGDTPLEDINLDLAEAFHVIPSGRSAGRHSEIKAARSEDKDDEAKIKAPIAEAKKEFLEQVEIKEEKQKSGTISKKVPSEKELSTKQNPESKFIQKIPKITNE